MQLDGNIRELRNVIERLIILSGEKLQRMMLSTLSKLIHTVNLKGYRTIEQFPNIEDVHKYIETAYTDFKEHQIE